MSPWWPAPRREAALTAAVALAAGATAYALADPAAILSGDQANIGAMLIAAREPADLAADPCFGDARHWAFYIPVYRAVLGALLDLTGDLGAAHRLLAAACVTIFVAGAIPCFARAGGSWFAGVLVALAATTVRDAPGGTYFGLGTMASAQPRSVALACVPWCAWLAAGGGRRAVAAAGLAGLAANLHPPTAAFTALGVLVAEARLGGLDRWRRCAEAAAVAALGALPALIGVWSSAGPAPAAPPAALASLVYDRFAPNLLPPPGFTLRLTAWAVAPVALLAWIAWKGRRDRGGGSPAARQLCWMGGGAFVGAWVLCALAQAGGWLTGGPPWSIDFLRGDRLGYLALYAWIAIGLRDLLTAETFPRLAPVRVGVAVAVAAALLVPPTAVRARLVAEARLETAESAARGAEIRAAGEWLRAHARGSLVASHEPALRIHGRVGVAFSDKEAGLWLHADRDRLLERSGAHHAWMAAWRASDRGTLLLLAGMAGARYALLPAAAAGPDAAWRGTRFALESVPPGSKG